jgi:type II secretory pathway pseudopilin PulG
MEMVVVLAVIAILAAVLTPIINSYVERARLSTARNDTKNLAGALVQHYTDMKFWPIYATTGEIPNGDAFVYMTTDGLPAAFDEDVEDSWDVAGDEIAASDTLNGKLSTNFYGRPSTGNLGASVYRGPYLETQTDPWGTKYYVTSASLKPASQDAAFVLSAGPNQTIETDMRQNRTGNVAFVVGGDDIVTRIR